MTIHNPSNPAMGSPWFPLATTLVQEQVHPILFATISGAHLYGYASANSDIDIRAVHVLPARLCLGLGHPPKTIERMGVREGFEIDVVSHDVKKFFRLLLKPNGLVLENVLSPWVIKTSEGHRRLIELAPACVTKRHAWHYLGLSRSQWKQFKALSPPRVKPLLYVYRALLCGVHLMQTGHLHADLSTLNSEHFRLSFIDDLLERKRTGDEKGTAPDLDLTWHEAEIARWQARLESEMDASTLPEQPAALPALESLLLDLRHAPELLCADTPDQA